MQKITYNVYKGFKCKAQNCKHSCCIGWEIDIDKRTLNKYNKVNTEFAKRLLNGIDKEKNCFKLDKSGRCVFLNKDNLCDIYINCGENYLCQVCSDHPRFRNFFNDRVEEGVGISCEKACEMLLFYDGEIKSESFDDGKKYRQNTPFLESVLSIREKIYSIINSGKNVENKVKSILNEVNVDENKIFDIDIKKLFSSFERLNDTLYQKIEKTTINFDNEIMQKHSKEFSNLLWYFVTRHVSNACDNLDIKSRTVFAILSVYIIFALIKNAKDERQELLEIAREYSAEVEYNDDNIFKFLDEIDRYIIK